LTLTVTPSRVRLGRTFVLRAVVNDSPPTAPPDGAEVEFWDYYGKSRVGRAPLDAGWRAQMRVTARNSFDNIEASFYAEGVVIYPIFASASVEVIEGFGVTIEFSTIPAQPVAGQFVIVNITATPVTEGGLNPPSGSVQVLSGGNGIGSGELGPGGSAAIPVILPTNPAPLTIAYEGDDLFSPITSSQSLIPGTAPEDPEPPTPTSVPAPPTQAEAELAAVATEPTVPVPTTAPDPAEDPAPEDEPAEIDDPPTTDEPAEVAAAPATTGDDDPAAFAAERSGLLSALPLPGDVDWSAAHTAASVLLALLLLGAMSLSAELVNGTIQDNYLRIFGATPGLRRLVERAENGAERIPDSLLVVLGGIGAALIGMLLDRNLGWNLSSLVLLVALSVVLGLVTAVLELARLPYLRARTGGSAGRFGLFPFAVALGVGLVVFSRISGFEPGFLFGVTCGLVLTKAVRDEDDGRSLAVSGVTLIVMAVVAWLAWGPVAERAADGDTGIGLLFADAALGTLWLAALQTVVFAYIPVSALAGSAVKTWNTKAWAVIWGVSVVLLVQLYIHPRGGQWGGVDSNTMRSALAVFGMLTVAALAFWAWFRFRPDPDPDPGEGGTDEDQAVRTSA